MAYIGAMPIDVIGLGEITLGAGQSAAISKSPYTNDQQVFDYNADMWTLSVSLPPLKRDLAEPWIAFLLRCRGVINTFTIGDPNCATPQGAWRDTDTISASGTVGGRSITVATTAGFKAGDYIQFGSGATARLHKILEDGGNGDSVEIYPCLRGTISSAAGKVENTVGRFRLAQNITNWQINSLSTYGIQFDCMEALP